MRLPVMQQEWQRRQTQRSAWVLLGLLAVVAAEAAPLPAMAPQGSFALTAGAASEALVEPVAEPGERRSRTDSSTLYWRAVATAVDRQTRVRLVGHAVTLPTVSAVDSYLRRFLRPPTR